MLHGDRPFGYRPDYHDRDHINIKRHRRERARMLCFRHNTTNGWVYVLQPCIEFSVPARCEREGSTLQRASCCVMPRTRATTSSPASLASPRRPVPPSIMPSRTKPASRGPIVSTTVPGGVVGAHNQDMRPTTMVPCDVPRSAAGRQSGDMGRARTLHSSRDLLFGSSLLIAEGGNGSSKLSWPLAALEIGNLQCLLT